MMRELIGKRFANIKPVWLFDKVNATKRAINLTERPLNEKTSCKKLKNELKLKISRPKQPKKRKKGIVKQRVTKKPIFRSERMRPMVLTD